MRHIRMLCALFIFVALFASLTSVRAQDATPMASAGPIEVVASGLTNPRGFTWSADGTLYLALAGSGGETRIEVAEGFTGDIGLSSSVVSVADGCTTTVVQGLVSFLWEEAGWIWGAMDVEILNGDLYALLSGAGPTNLSPSSFSGVFKINDDGTMDLIADITTWLPDHPPAFIPPDYSSDGSLFDLEATSDALLLSEAVGGQLLKVTPAGEISQVADLSEGHLVPTGIAVDDEGNAYVGFETTPPYADGSSKVVKVTPDGTVSDYWTGLTAVTDVEFGPDGTLYATEMATGNTGTEPFLNPNSGRIVRQTGADTLEPVVTELPYPVHIGFDADGRLVIAAPAFGPDAGVGQGVLVSVDLAQTPVSYEGFEAPKSCA
jgi:sugar lactone lactonase YvrE